MKVYTDKEIEKLISDKFENIDIIAMKEYKDFMYLLENNFSYYNLCIASINACLGEMVFSTQDEIPNFEELTPKAFKALRTLTEYSPVYSSVSLDYIKFIALTQPISDKSKEFKDAVNELRNDEKEWEFLKGFNKLTEEKGYYAIDLYVEDMLADNRILKFKGIRLNDRDSLVLEAEKENITESINDPEIVEYLKKYNRRVNYSDEFQNKQWNLFLFKKRDVQPKGIILELKTYGRRELLELSQ